MIKIITHVSTLVQSKSLFITLYIKKINSSNIGLAYMSLNKT